MGFPRFRVLSNRKKYSLSRIKLANKIENPKIFEILTYDWDIQYSRIQLNPILSRIFQLFLARTSPNIYHAQLWNKLPEKSENVSSSSSLSFETKESDCDAYKTAAFLNFHDGGASVERIGVWITIEARWRERERERFILPFLDRFSDLRTRRYVTKPYK